MISKQRFRCHLCGEAKIKLLQDKTIVNTYVANISLSGIGLYSPIPIDNGGQVQIKVSFFDIAHNVQQSVIEGTTIWHSKLGHAYLMGIRFNEELNETNQPMLFNRLLGIKNTNHLKKHKAFVTLLPS